MGREIECVTFGSGPRTCWVIHRQHPGESMASFFAEGLLGRLLGLDDVDGGGGGSSGESPEDDDEVALDDAALDRARGDDGGREGVVPAKAIGGGRHGDDLHVDYKD